MFCVNSKSILLKIVLHKLAFVLLYSVCLWNNLYLRNILSTTHMNTVKELSSCEVKYFSSGNHGVMKFYGLEIFWVFVSLVWL